MQAINEQAKQSSAEWAALLQPHGRGFTLPTEGSQRPSWAIGMYRLQSVQHLALHTLVEEGPTATVIAPNHMQTSGPQNRGSRET